MSRMPLVAKQYAEKQRFKRAQGAQRIGADNFKPSGSIEFCRPRNVISSKSPVKQAQQRSQGQLIAEERRGKAFYDNEADANPQKQPKHDAVGRPAARNEIKPQDFQPKQKSHEKSKGNKDGLSGGKEIAVKIKNGRNDSEEIKADVVANRFEPQKSLQQLLGTN